ncbi:hypothetical protein DDF62_13740 [Caulobacter radicis]|uniref:hypothetical protein n=1 Tax=Caulobacter radicis TaxID=2172650 RepID=UPI000D566430|nr:hypothetical protein [Caulobacter radicis]PVM88978.1 hypothetical protein DDF62_13740 [Caulobacter radicis]
MPKSKPPRTRLRRAPNGKPLSDARQRMIAACDDNIAFLQRMQRQVEQVALRAPAEEVANFREHTNEGIRCWTAVRDMQYEFQRDRSPAWPGIAKALKAYEAEEAMRKRP